MQSFKRGEVLVRVTVAVAIVCLSLVGLSAGAEVDAAIRKPTNIPAQPLGQALQALAKERGFQVVYVSDEVDSRTTHGASGDLTVDQALTQLLNGTGLTYRHTGDGGVSIVPVEPGSAAVVGSKATGEDSRKDNAATAGKDGRSFWSRFRLAQAPQGGAAQSYSVEQGENQQAPQKGAAELEEIVVTAQKRSENIQSVPISITAVTGEELHRQGVVDILALANVAPGVQVSTGVLGPQINIRGITSTNSTEVGDPAVAFHVDGIYAGRPRSAAGTFFDVERIEVLRGPQGTLYGRNATAGSVNVITNKPRATFEAAASVEAGNYGLITTTGVLNVPLTSWAAFRAAVQSYKHDGYTNNAPSPNANDADIRAGRLHLLLTPTESLSVLLSGDVFRNTDIVGIQLRPLPFNGDPFTFPIDNGAGNPRNDQKQNGGSVTLNWTVGPGTLTYIGAYRNDELGSSGPSSTSPVPVKVLLTQDQQSHELRMSGDVSALKWLGGVFYYDEHQTVNVLVPAGPTILGFNQNPVKAASKALFTQETYSIRPDVRLTGGLRYSKDTKSRLGGVFVNGALVSPNIAADDWSAVNYRAAIDWDVTSSALLYASVSTGYKAGGYMDGVPPNAYGPEHLTAFEVGSKNRLLDNRVQLNASTYYYDYKDYQVSYAGLLFPEDPNSPVITRTTNAKKAVNYGAEAELLFAVTSHDRVNATMSWLHATYKDLRLAFTDLFGRSDYSGNRLVGAPEFSANLGYEHTWSLGTPGDLTARGQIQYVGNQDLDYRNLPLTREGGYATANANVIYTSADARWTVEVWGRNLANKVYLVAAAPNTNPADPTRGTGTLGAPRTYGLRVAAHF